MKEMSVLCIWDRMGDYHLARIKACRERIKGNVYSADLGAADSLYQWDNVDANHHYMLSEQPVHKKDFIHRFKMYRSILREKNISHVAMGYGRMEYLVFLLYARLTGCKTIVFCESWYTRGQIKDFFKSLLLKTIGNAFFVSGQRAYNHFVKNYRINAASVFTGYSVVDNTHFVLNEQIPKKYLLCVARYSEEKNLEFLIRAFVGSRLSETYELLMIGDGPLREELSNTIRLLKTDRVILSGWKTYKELPFVYAGAIACILPSTFEPWGLVVNEAMAVGLPVLLSDECGCLPDLLVQNENGWRFNPYHANELLNILNDINVLDREMLYKMGGCSKVLIDFYSVDTWAEKINTMLTMNLG
jgi:1,2-diacylglycerol 3-alpha-glucosyltransferase